MDTIDPIVSQFHVRDYRFFCKINKIRWDILQLSVHIVSTWKVLLSSNGRAKSA